MILNAAMVGRSVVGDAYGVNYLASSTSVSSEANSALYLVIPVAAAITASVTSQGLLGIRLAAVINAVASFVGDLLQQTKLAGVFTSSAVSSADRLHTAHFGLTDDAQTVINTTVMPRILVEPLPITASVDIMRVKVKRV